jgi:hypothetical protein
MRAVNSSILSPLNSSRVNGQLSMARENMSKLMLCSRIYRKLQVPTESELRSLNGLKFQILELLRDITMQLNLTSILKNV